MAKRKTTSASAKKIEDFGEKIGGARKDLWRTGLTEADLLEMNDAEKAFYVTRDALWPLPDAKKLVEEGMSPFVAYWRRMVRLKLRNRPYKAAHETFNDAVSDYVAAGLELKAMTQAVKTEADIINFYAALENKRDLRKHMAFPWRYQVNYSIYSLRYQHGTLRARMKDFPYNGRDGHSRRKSFVPPQLESIEREGPDYRHGVNIDDVLWQDRFNFRGVEFGNWTSQLDRQASLNYCYDALLDLARVLDIEDTEIAFGGKLALAFGSRGHGNARAHYEPMREVINLTKMSGAGSTAHEWMHALDDHIAKACGIRGSLASEALDNPALPKSFVRLVNALKKDANDQPTEYYKGSSRFGLQFAKEAHGYWNSNAEMLARAFACYVKDSLGCKSDYLIAHADCYKFELENQGYCAIPQDEERELFDELFDEFIEDAKQRGLLKARTEASNKEILVVAPSVNTSAPRKQRAKSAVIPKDGKDVTVNAKRVDYSVLTYEGKKGQMTMRFA